MNLLVCFWAHFYWWLAKCVVCTFFIGHAGEYVIVFWPCCKLEDVEELGSCGESSSAVSVAGVRAWWWVDYPSRLKCQIKNLNWVGWWHYKRQMACGCNLMPIMCLWRWIRQQLEFSFGHQKTLVPTIAGHRTHWRSLLKAVKHFTLKLNKP